MGSYHGDWLQHGPSESTLASNLPPCCSVVDWRSTFLSVSTIHCGRIFLYISSSDISLGIFCTGKSLSGHPGNMGRSSTAILLLPRCSAQSSEGSSFAPLQLQITSFVANIFMVFSNFANIFPCRYIVLSLEQYYVALFFLTNAIALFSFSF